nr:MAG TPA_asm: hypothetical protein [Caudoviricetes sp.]
MESVKIDRITNGNVISQDKDLPRLKDIHVSRGILE